MRLLPLLPHLLAHLRVAWPVPVFPFTLALPVMLTLTPGPLHSLGLLPRVLLPAPGSPPGHLLPLPPPYFLLVFCRAPLIQKFSASAQPRGHFMLMSQHVSYSVCPRPCWLPCQPPFQHPCSTSCPYFQLPAWASCFAGPRAVPGGPSQWARPQEPPPPPRAWLLASCLCHCPLPGASQTSRCPLVVKCRTGSSGFLGVGSG